MATWLIFTPLFSNAQTVIKINEPVCTPSKQQMVPDKNGVYTAVDDPADFQGGNTAFQVFLAKNIRYPDKSKTIDVQGKVFVRFIVEEDGSLSNFKILRGLGYSFDEEAVRVLKSSPRWKPGKHNGKLVKEYYTVPISFTIGG